VADSFDTPIEQKVFHCEIVVDNERVAAETKAYRKIPVITNFVDDAGVDRMREMVKENYDRIKAEVKHIVEDEIKRIEGDDDLKHLLQKKEEYVGQLRAAIAALSCHLYPDRLILI
jgi:hypothetical protein